MVISIKNPQHFNITDSSGRTTYGGDQEWYIKNWHQRAGCGPTSATNLIAYLALTNSNKRFLYDYKTVDKQNFSYQMETLFNYVTPGAMGVNHIEMFINGMKTYSEDREIPIQVHSFSVDKKTLKSRNRTDLIDFIKKGLSNDCPLAFLALSRGKESRMQNWHWITITSVDIMDDAIIATASDEGRIRHFDLQLWYETTKMHGGLIYID
jgi:hypothetical protein